MDYEQQAQTRFAGLGKDQLRAACKEIGITIGPNESEASMRTKLCANFGVAADDQTATKPVEVKKSGGMPNLDPDGAWGGRWHYVTIGSSNPRLSSCPVGWQGNYRNLPLGEEVKIIAPHYNVLREAHGERITQQSYRDEDNIQKFRQVQTKFSEFFITSSRPDPETAHLPGDYIEYFQGIVKKDPTMTKLNRKQLSFIAMKLECEIRDGETMHPIRVSDIKGMSDDDLRHLISLKLIPGYGMDIFADVEAA